jgi:hypothetical protein
MTKLISGRVAKVNSANVSADRYDFLSLDEAEPDLGLPAVAGRPSPSSELEERVKSIAALPEPSEPAPSSVCEREPVQAETEGQVSGLRRCCCEKVAVGAAGEWWHMWCPFCAGVSTLVSPR